MNSVSREPYASASAAPRSAPSGAIPSKRTCTVAVTRPRSASGITVWRRLTIAIRSIVPSPSPKSCGMKRKTAATAGGPNASGVRNEIGIAARLRRTIVGPMPSRRTVGPANAAPASEPTPPREIATPRMKGESPSSRRTSPDHLESFNDLAPRRSLATRNGKRLTRADEKQRDRRGQERNCVDDDRRDRGEELHDRAGEYGRADLRDRFGHAELGVAFDDPLQPDERRQISAIRDVEERSEDGGEERDEVEELDAQGAGDPRDRDREQQRRA